MPENIANWIAVAEIAGAIFMAVMTPVCVVLWFVIRRLVSSVDAAGTKLDHCINTLTDFAGKMDTMRETTELKIVKNSEQIAEQRSRVGFLESEIVRLRDVRHDHDNVLTGLSLRIEQLLRRENRATS